MIPKNDLTNKKFNMLKVISKVENNKQNNSKWLCQCDCGNMIEVLGIHLRSGHTKSCGCLRKTICKNINHKKKHGLINIRLYKIWNGIKNRTNPNSKFKNTSYKNYSGRNIKMCDEWKNNFIAFYNWAISNGYKDNLTIDRIDNNGDYEPSNCRWITIKQQQNNKRNNRRITFNNETYTISEWNDILNYPYGLIKTRLHRGWSIERAMTTPKVIK